MKKLSFLALAAVGLLFGACSSDKDTVGETPNGPEYDGQFLAFNINLPSDPQSITRANDNGSGTLVDNGTNTDGLPVEYAVKNAILLVFDGSAANQDAANFKSAYEIATHPWENNTDPHVTETSKRIIQEVSGVVDNDLMLIILNNNGIVTVDGSNVKINGKPFVVGTDFTSTTYEDFRKAIATTTTLGASAMTTAGFYMANAVLANESGSQKEGTAPTTGFAVNTLVPITKVFKTHAEAEAAGTVDEVFVERGMAKVTVQKNDKKAMTGLTTLKWQISGWTLDNTNTKSYLVRSTDNVTTGSQYFLLNSQADNTKEGYKNYRFMGNSTIITASDYKYRTYFAEDPNFTSDATAELTQATLSDYKTTFGDKNPQYCFENTFDVPHQNENQTTLARLEITSTVGDNPAENLFTLGNVKSTYYTTTTLITKIQERAYAYLNENSLITGTFDSGDLTVTLPTDPAAGELTITSITTTKGSALSGGALPADIIDKTVEYLGGKIICYKGGKSYYTVRIKHFGDVLTPWKDGVAGVAIGTIYPTASQADNYLGRYGVLRNNWYDIQVTDVAYLGDATPQAHTGVTDDEIKAFIAFKINVLSWAKRTQQWNF